MIVLAPREVSPISHTHTRTNTVSYDTPHAAFLQGEHFWRTDDVVKLIEEQGDSIALVWLPGKHTLP